MSTRAIAGTMPGLAGKIELLAPVPFDLATVVGSAAPNGPADNGHAGVRVATRAATCDATYFDSADLTLASQGTTLTRAADGTWLLESLTEHVAEASEDGAHRVPSPIRDRLHPSLRSRRLRPVARLVTDRITIEVSIGSTQVVRAVHDDVTAHAPDGIRRFGRVALVPTAPAGRNLDLLHALAEACAAAGCTPAPRANELQLACGVLSPTGALLAPMMPRRPRSATLGELVAPMLGASVERLVAHDAGVRLGTDPEDVHQLRVATRRLRADLRALRPALDRPRAAQLRAEVQWLGSLAGPVRDADVLTERLTAVLAALPETPDDDKTRLLRRLAAQRRRHHDALLTGMRTARYDALLDLLGEAVAHPPVRRTKGARAGRRASSVLKRATARQWRDLADTVHRVGKTPTAADLHQVRIAAKHARYTADAATPVLGKHAARLAGLATRAQTLLGDLHDAVVAQDWLQDAEHDPALVPVAERVSAVERERAADLQAQWQPLWAKIRRKANRELKALTAR